MRFPTCGFAAAFFFFLRFSRKNPGFVSYVLFLGITNNLIEHFSKWKKYIHKHGLIILELHTVNPKTTANNQNNLLSCSYDATHGYSDQYLVEYDTFIECANLANMQLYFESELFPNNENPTISINYFI